MTTSDIDLGMLDASEWQSAPVRGEDAPPDPPWVDCGPDTGADAYADTGARSDDRPAWIRARRTGIGASEIAAVLGESRWGDAGTVYARKVERVEDTEAEWLEWGLRLEPVILAAFSSERYAGRRANRDGRLLRSREHPWALCTLDAWQLHLHSGETYHPLELKTDRWGTEWDKGIPTEYVWQLQHQMLVTGAAMASIAVLVGGSQLAWADVERNEAMIARIIRAGERFWQQVETRDMPETIDHAALASVFRHEERRTVELSGVEWMIADAKRCEAAAVEKTARLEQVTINARIKRAMGHADVARLDDGTEYRWVTHRDGKRVLTRKEARV